MYKSNVRDSDLLQWCQVKLNNLVITLFVSAVRIEQETNPMERSFSWETISVSASQDIILPLENAKIN